MIKVAIGQDSHAFEKEITDRRLMLGGICIPNHRALKGNSDADVILHSLTNAISGITTKPILGKCADVLVEKGIIDSSFYLKEALKDLQSIGLKISHISIAIECLNPKINPYQDSIQAKIAFFCKIMSNDVGITATTGEGLSDFGKGLGIFCSSVVTATSL